MGAKKSSIASAIMSRLCAASLLGSCARDVIDTPHASSSARPERKLAEKSLADARGGGGEALLPAEPRRIFWARSESGLTVKKSSVLPHVHSCWLGGRLSSSATN